MSSTGPVPSSTNDTAPTCRPIIFFPVGAAASGSCGATVAASATADDLTKSRRVIVACIFISINACASKFNGNYFVIENGQGCIKLLDFSLSPIGWRRGQGRGGAFLVVWPNQSV